MDSETQRKNHVPGYMPVLIHDSLKESLRQLGDSLGDGHLRIQRVIATALIKYGLTAAKAPEVKAVLEQIARDIVVKDMQASSV